MTKIIRHAVGSLEKRTHPLLGQYLTWIRTTQCPTVRTHTPHCMQEDQAYGGYIAWLVAPYDTHTRKRWLNSNPRSHWGARQQATGVQDHKPQGCKTPSHRGARPQATGVQDPKPQGCKAPSHRSARPQATGVQDPKPQGCNTPSHRGAIPQATGVQDPKPQGCRP